MPRIDPTTIAQTLLSAPGWARVGLSAPTERMRDSAASELARVIAEELGFEPTDSDHPDQLPLTM